MTTRGMASLGDILRSKGMPLYIEIVEDVLDDVEVRELRAFAALGRHELGIDVAGDVERAQAPISGPAIFNLQRRGYLFGAKLTRAGWEALAVIERDDIPFGRCGCVICGETIRDGFVCGTARCASAVAVIEDVAEKRSRSR